MTQRLLMERRYGVSVIHHYSTKSRFYFHVGAPNRWSMLCGQWTQYCWEPL